MKRKIVLYVGKSDAELQALREWARQVFAERDQPAPLFITAKDGADAATKTDNQPFDLLVIDTEVPRLKEGTFLAHLSQHPHTKSAAVIALIHSARPFEILARKLEYLAKPVSRELLFETFSRVLELSSLTTAPKPKSAKGDRFAVDVRVLNAILKAAEFVCGQFGVQNLNMQKAERRRAGLPWAGEVGAYLAINSQVFRGTLVVSFQAPLYLHLVSQMLGEYHAALNDENLEAIGEITNMILGNAKSDFSQYQIEMTIPQMLRPNQLVPTVADSISMLVPFAHEKGHMYIEILAHPVAA